MGPFCFVLFTGEIVFQLDRCKERNFRENLISDYEVEHDRAKFVTGLGMISEIDPGGALDAPSFCKVIIQITLEVGVPATWCLRHY